MTDDTGEMRGTAVGSLPGRGELALLAVGALFWGWLLVRWINDWFLDPQPVRSREPFLPAGQFEAAEEAVAAAAAGLGPLSGPVEWIAWLFGVAALGVESGPAMAAGAWITVVLTVAAILLGLLFAVPLAVARVYGGPVASGLSLSFTELIRGTPLLAQLFVLYFGLPLSGFFADAPLFGGAFANAAVWVAIVGFTINSSAYQAEYIRSALESVDPGQLVAARSVGLSKLQGIRYVVLPQGLRFAIPGWTNEFIYLIKYSSLAAFITVPELFRRARNVGSDTFQFTEIYVVAALFYLALVLTTATAMGRLERAVSIPGLGGE